MGRSITIRTTPPVLTVTTTIRTTGTITTVFGLCAVPYPSSPVRQKWSLFMDDDLRAGGGIAPDSRVRTLAVKAERQRGHHLRRAYTKTEARLGFAPVVPALIVCLLMWENLVSDYQNTKS